MASAVQVPQPPPPPLPQASTMSRMSTKASRAIFKPIELPPITNKKLINILRPKRPMLPVVLPPVGQARRDTGLATKPKEAASSETIIPVMSEQLQDNGKIVEKNEVPYVEGDDDPNPFEYPENPEPFLELAEAARAEKRKEEDAATHFLMKGTMAFRQNQTVLARIKPFLQPALKPSLARDYKQIVWKAQHGLHITHLQKVSRKMHTEYAAQRKNIYYLRRAIRARKIALEMIRQTREFEEACLKDYEWLTEFTKEAFDNFLQENDDETHKAARKAELALKEKLDKTLECRQLNIQINQIKTDIIATNESLRECKVYMRFLNDIAREIMRKDEEEEIIAMHRELQIKEELSGYLKEGMSVETAQALIQEKAKEFYDETARLSGQSSTAFGGGSLEFIMNLNEQVRKHLGLPDEPLEEEKRKSEATEEKQRRRSSLEEEERYGRKSVTVEEESLPGKGRRKSVGVEDGGDTAGRRSLDQNMVSSAIAKKQTRLKQLLQKEEEDNRKPSVDASASKGFEDADGYNEVALLRSLELVPGNEASDRRELASLVFTRPSQLLQIYSDMEETNLSLIQHSQASEELLERVNQQILHTRRALNHRGRLLREDINHMQANIDTNEEKATALAMLVEMFTGGNYDVRQQQKLFKILQRHISKVYKTTVGTIDQHLNPIMMLTSIEKNFEDLMREIQAMPTDVVVQISRELDKERREMERVEKMNRRKAVQEERKSRALDRAKAPAHRRKGRPLLARSHPPKVVIHLSQEELDRKAEEDEFNYFFGP